MSSLRGPIELLGLSELLGPLEPLFEVPDFRESVARATAKFGENACFLRKLSSSKKTEKTKRKSENFIEINISSRKMQIKMQKHSHRFFNFDDFFVLFQNLIELEEKKPVFGKIFESRKNF